VYEQGYVTDLPTSLALPTFMHSKFRDFNQPNNKPTGFQAFRGFPAFRISGFQDFRISRLQHSGNHLSVLRLTGFQDFNHDARSLITQASRPWF
jgi:hypothetical protein